MVERFPTPEALVWVERWRREHAAGLSVVTDPMRAVELEVVRGSVQSAIDAGYTYEQFADVVKVATDG